MMLRNALRLLALTFLLHGPCAPPAEARRVALVIGNAAYKTGPLRHPVASATAVAAVFERPLGFDKVTLGKNLGRKAFGAALQDLARGLAGAETGLVYFAGRGVEVDGRILLLPVDAEPAVGVPRDTDAVPLDVVLDHLAGAGKLRLVILDTSWDIPPRLGRPPSVKGAPLRDPARDALVVLATRPGATLVEHADSRSAFTEALLKHVLTPGLEIRFLFGNVRDDVLTLTGGRQVPFVYGMLGREPVYLNPPRR